MNREEFLRAIFKLFGKGEDLELLRQYDIALSTDKKIDWQKLYNLTINEVEKRTLPMPKFFIDRLHKCIDYSQTPAFRVGGTYRIITNDGNYHDFVVCNGSGLQSLYEVQNWFTGLGIKSCKFYDNTYTFCGKNIYNANGVIVND